MFIIKYSSHFSFSIMMGSCFCYKDARPRIIAAAAAAAATAPAVDQFFALSHSNTRNLQLGNRSGSKIWAFQATVTNDFIDISD